MINRLKHLKDIKDKIDIINLEMEFINNEYVGLSAPPYSKEPTTGGVANKCPLLSKMIKYDIKLENYKNDLEELKKEYLDERNRMMILIDCLEGDEYRVIYYRYIQCMSINEIRDKMFIGRNTFYRWRDNAIAKLEDQN